MRVLNLSLLLFFWIGLLPAQTMEVINYSHPPKELAQAYKTIDAILLQQDWDALRSFATQLDTASTASGVLWRSMHLDKLYQRMLIYHDTLGVYSSGECQKQLNGPASVIMKVESATGTTAEAFQNLAAYSLAAKDSCAALEWYWVAFFTTTRINRTVSYWINRTLDKADSLITIHKFNAAALLLDDIRQNGIPQLRANRDKKELNERIELLSDRLARTKGIASAWHSSVKASQKYDLTLFADFGGPIGTVSSIMQWIHPLDENSVAVEIPKIEERKRFGGTISVGWHPNPHWRFALSGGMLYFITQTSSFPGVYVHIPTYIYWGSSDLRWTFRQTIGIRPFVSLRLRMNRIVQRKGYGYKHYNPDNTNISYTKYIVPEKKSIAWQSGIGLGIEYISSTSLHRSISISAIWNPPMKIPRVGSSNWFQVNAGYGFLW